MKLPRQVIEVTLPGAAIGAEVTYRIPELFREIELISVCHVWAGAARPEMQVRTKGSNLSRCTVRAADSTAAVTVTFSPEVGGALDTAAVKVCPFIRSLKGGDLIALLDALNSVAQTGGLLTYSVNAETGGV